MEMVDMLSAQPQPNNKTQKINIKQNGKFN